MAPYTGSSGSELLYLLMKTLRRQSRVIAAVFVAGLLATLGVLMIVTPRFVATASVLLDTRQQRVFNSESVLPGLTDDLYIVESQVEIIRSSRIASAVLESLTPKDRAAFEDRPLKAGFLFASRSGSEPIQVSKLSPSQDDAKVMSDTAASGKPVISSAMIERLLKGLRVERVGHSYMVEVSFTDVDRRRAATIANAFVDGYLADQLQAKFQATRKANEWLSERVVEIGRELTDAERRQQEFEDQQEIIEVGSVSLLQKELADYAQQLVAARGAVAETQARLEQVHRLTDNPEEVLSLDAAQNSKTVSELRRQAAEIRRKIGDGISRYGEQHNSVLAAKAELVQLHEELKKESDRIARAAALALEAATDKARLLEAGMRQLKQRATELAHSRVRQSELRREIDVSSTLYSNLLRRYKETRAQEKLQAADARVVSRAIAPPQAAFPRKTLVLALGGLAWLGLGFALGLARELSTPSLRTPEDVEHALGLACVGAVPVVDPMQSADGASSGHTLLGPIDWSVDEETSAGFNQAIFTLRRWIGFAPEGGARVVIVTSAQPGAGASTIAVQLARYAGRTGTKTLLIDADLRANGLTHVLGGSAERSLGAIARGETPVEDAVQHLGEHEFDFLAAPERGTFEALDVLGARSMEGLFRSLREQYRLIIVDTPSSAEFVDASALAEYADGVLVVLKSGPMQASRIPEILNQLEPDREVGPEPGIVLNMAAPAAG